MRGSSMLSTESTSVTARESASVTASVIAIELPSVGGSSRSGGRSVAASELSVDTVHLDTAPLQSLTRADLSCEELEGHLYRMIQARDVRAMSERCQSDVGVMSENRFRRRRLHVYISDRSCCSTRAPRRAAAGRRIPQAGTRPVLVQGPVTYLRKRGTPRFQPLADWGALVTAGS